MSFGFGSLAGIVRNHRNVTVSLRRKALASLIQLAEKHTVPTVSAALSVAFNDPSKQIRRDAFVIALNHHDALGLSWEQIIRQASNAVSLRNAENAASGSSNVDILNQLIVSELNHANRQDLLLEMIRTQPHNLGYVSLELLLNVKTTEQETVVAGLTAALQSPNRNIRNQLVSKITSELQEVLQYNQRLLEEEHKFDYLSDEPYWDLLVQALDHIDEYCGCCRRLPHPTGEANRYCIGVCLQSMASIPLKPQSSAVPVRHWKDCVHTMPPRNCWNVCM